MTKGKVLIVTIILTFVFGLTVMISNIGIKNRSVIDNCPPIIDIPILGEPISIIETPSKITEGVIVKGKEEIDNGLLVYGSYHNYPYIELINDDTKIATDFQKYEGEIVSIIDNNYYLTAKIATKDGQRSQAFFIANDKIIPFYKEQLTINYSAGVTIKPEYLVIHETANTSVGANANAHYRYWSTNPTAKASTHFVVDSNEIYQMLELNQMGWHVGDNKGYSDIKNTNSIGMEIAVNADGDFELARKHAIALSVYIMNELDMDISQLKRHHDASGKYCPTNMLNESYLWDEFKELVYAGLNKK